jgi:hypothetical protein
MRFTIEQRHLTDESGKPVSMARQVSFHTCDADSVDEALHFFVKEQGGEVIGDVLKFPGFQAIATVRDAGGVYTLQLTPASQRYA